LDFARNKVFDSFFDLPLKTFCLKTSLFLQIHPPKFYFSGSITHKLTLKTKISKFTCILVFSISQKFSDKSKLSPNSKIFYILSIGAMILQIRPWPLKSQTTTPPFWWSSSIFVKILRQISNFQNLGMLGRF
jgi:hypothetical protein